MGFWESLDLVQKVVVVMLVVLALILLSIFVLGFRGMIGGSDAMTPFYKVWFCLLRRC